MLRSTMEVDEEDETFPDVVTEETYSIQTGNMKEELKIDEGHE